MVEDAFLRVAQICGVKAVTKDKADENKARGRGIKREREAVRGILPISRSGFLAGVREGKYPAPVKIGPRTTVWRRSEILAILDRDWPAPGGPAFVGRRRR